MGAINQVTKTIRGGSVAKYVELRRHADNEDDVLSTAGVRQALEIGAGLDGDYDLLVSSGAQRATQNAGVLPCGHRPKGAGRGCAGGLRSRSEDSVESRLQGGR